MSLLKLINEMTMKVGSYAKLGEYLHLFGSLDRTGEHVGDIEQFKVFKKTEGLDRYAIFDGEKVIAFFITKPKEQSLETAFVADEFRKKGLFSAFLLFLKRNEGYDKIVLGELHSADTIEAVKKIHSRFNTYWEKDGKTEPYSVDTLDNFYSLSKPSGWKLVLENDGDFSSFPKFFDCLNLKTYYFPMVDE